MRSELARRELQRRRARRDPLYLVSQMTAVDQRDGSRFDFRHLAAPSETLVRGHTVAAQPDWRWQRLLAERVLEAPRLICLKGRQIGVTWVVLAVDVAETLLTPGTSTLIYRQREDDAVDNVRRWWTLYQSLPQHWKQGIKVLNPDRSLTPGRDGVRLMFPDGAVSEIVPMTSAAASGHGRTVKRVILDEAAYVEKLAEIGAAVEPAAGRAHIVLVSTANGRSNPETGEGNEFHRRWVSAEEAGYERLFLPYDVHPDRDQAWYDAAPEVQALRLHQRHAQFPRDEHEAFALTNRVFFDPDTLTWYRDHVSQPLRRGEFKPRGPRSAAFTEGDGGWKILQEPQAERHYALAADVATGRGADYSTAIVLDLAEMQVCAQYRAKIDADLFATQLHYMGRRYNTAWLAVETGGGYGEAVIIPLRDGRAGRPPYPNLYRHVLSSRPDQPTVKPYGFPTNLKTRPLILNQLEKALRDKHLPYVTDELLYEMESFVLYDSGTSPRAQEGSNDDLVLALAIALELYRLRGHHPDRRSRTTKRRYQPQYPWQHAA